MVPDSSERKFTTIGAAGRFLPGFSAAIAGSFHVLTVPLKTLASVGPSSARSVTPATL